MYVMYVIMHVCKYICTNVCMHVGVFYVYVSLCICVSLCACLRIVAQERKYILVCIECSLYPQ